MPCPDRDGEITDYEEVWRTVPARPGPPWGWILQSVDGKCFVGRIGGNFMAMRQLEVELEGRKAFGVRLELLEESGTWWSQWALGLGLESVPSMVGLGRQLEGEEGWKAGDVVELAGEEFVVRAWSRL